MTVLLQTRVSRGIAARFKAAAQAEGKSTYQALRDLAEEYSRKGRKFASEAYTERFALPEPSRLKEELRVRMERRHARDH